MKHTIGDKCSKQIEYNCTEPVDIPYNESIHEGDKEEMEFILEKPPKERTIIMMFEVIEANIGGKESEYIEERKWKLCKKPSKKHKVRHDKMPDIIYLHSGEPVKNERNIGGKKNGGVLNEIVGNRPRDNPEKYLRSREKIHTVLMMSIG